MAAGQDIETFTAPRRDTTATRSPGAQVIARSFSDKRPTPLPPVLNAFTGIGPNAGRYAA